MSDRGQRAVENEALKRRLREEGLERADGGVGCEGRADDYRSCNDYGNWKKRRASRWGCVLRGGCITLASLCEARANFFAVYSSL